MNAVDSARNADAVLERKNGTLVFVEPYEIMESFTDFLDYVQADVSNSNGGGARPVKYAQTRKQGHCAVLQTVLTRSRKR